MHFRTTTGSKFSITMALSSANLAHLAMVRDNSIIVGLKWFHENISNELLILIPPFTALYIAVHNPTSNIFVSDSANNRICVFDCDGIPIYNIGHDGPPFFQVKMPRGLAVDNQVCIFGSIKCRRILDFLHFV